MWSFVASDVFPRMFEVKIAALSIVFNTDGLKISSRPHCSIIKVILGHLVGLIVTGQSTEAGHL